MATIYITEYASLGTQLGDIVQAAHAPPLAVQTITISGASTQCSAFNAATKLVRVNSDSVCSIAFGTNPTATTSSTRLPANTTEYFALTPGLSLKMAVISNT